MNTVKKIDIHSHTVPERDFWREDGSTLALPEELIEIYDQIGVDKAVLLPLLKIEQSHDLNSNREIRHVAEKYPDRFYWFCDIDPRQLKNSPESDFTDMINYYKSIGAKGIGELQANIYFDDPRAMNLFKYCEKLDMPIIFHIGSIEGDYGLIDEIGLPRLEKVLKTFPNLKLLGHSQRFWAEIDANVTAENRCGYPEGKVTPGRIVELMRKYPNLCGDLSAGSGYNAISRDPEFGYAFLEEFQDRLFFGTDIASPRNITDMRVKTGPFLDEAMQNGKISYEAYYKICRGNALALLER